MQAILENFTNAKTGSRLSLHLLLLLFQLSLVFDKSLDAIRVKFAQFKPMRNFIKSPDDLAWSAAK